MYGTREALCTELARMFTHDEPLALLVWTEEGFTPRAGNCTRQMKRLRLCWKRSATATWSVSPGRRHGCVGVRSADPPP
ncbi:Uncharacterised protein [Klebsiella pneumoniae subsp. ozaenae]|uniref:Uncharacterized protein n=1 Tax=Klebsiella pneumoniae subsp. ozaenae TaxID=574 RepID=A0A378UCH0_KLEPO|nr:Uncharacterised protein [Klebsiella pneumoniae subsp. ozaenae]